MNVSKRTSALLACLALGASAWISGCSGLGSSSGSTGGTGSGTGGGGNTGGSINSVNHIIWHLQENRSFDNYFGQLNAYRQSKGLAADVNGLPAGASNPDFSGTSQVPAYHEKNYIIENVSAAWNETHVQFSRQYLTTPGNQVTSYPMDGFVYTAAKFAQDNNANGANPPYQDTQGTRAMGYYDQTDMPYYYWLATQFSTSDSFFSPVPSRTTPNRLFAFAATSQGWTYPPTQQLTAQTIFDLLDKANITWKVYQDPAYPSYLNYFTTSNNASTKAKIVPLSQYFTDLQNGTLPQVAYIDQIVQDEHPDEDIRCGMNSTQQLIDALQKSSAWKDSVFFLAYDEMGGIYDHVAPQKTVAPDNSPVLLERPTDIIGDFTLTGGRVPIMVVSPFAKSGFVSHTAMDTTSILKFIETRFSLGTLTARDAAQPAMDFFDFSTSPNLNFTGEPAPVANVSCPVSIETGG